MVKVSIIVPVYNVEDYLAKCLDSCLGQDFEDIEVVCVNDGSTDRSVEILDAYAKFDSRIRIINKENGGLSSARNAGIREACGKYIMFVDSDDWIASNAVGILYQNAENNNSDMVIFDYIHGNIKLKKQMHITISSFGSTYVNKSFNIEQMPASSYKEIAVAAWCKFYRSSFIKDKFSFYEDMIFEDVPFWAEVFSCAKTITYIPEPFYYYSVGRQGQIMDLRGEELFDVVKAYSRVFDSLHKFGHYEKYKCQVTLLMMMDFLRKFYLINPQFREKLFDTYKAIKQDIDYDFYESNEFTGYEKLYVKYYKLLKTLSYEEFCKIPFEVGHGK